MGARVFWWAYSVHIPFNSHDKVVNGALSIPY